MRAQTRNDACEEPQLFITFLSYERKSEHEGAKPMAASKKSARKATRKTTKKTAKKGGKKKASRKKAK